MDKIIIQGGYAGASADNLDKLALSKIEKEVAKINGVIELESIISPGVFMITATLKEGADTTDILSKVKDAISLAKQDFPPDMEEPGALILEAKIPLLHIAVSSQTRSDEELLAVSREMERRLANIPHLSGIEIYGEGDKEIEISLDSKKLEAYGVSIDEAVNALSNISYIFPLGKIEGKEAFYYVNSAYGKQDRESMLNTTLRIGGKQLYIKDIANVNFKREDTPTLSLHNGEEAYVISVSKDKEGSAIELASTVKRLVKEYETELKDVHLNPHGDTSVFIKNRLSTVISSITFGFILVTLSMFILINWRISVVVALGIPFSFIIGVIFFDLSGNTINMVSLLGALIAVGVLVDDAIIVAENIQRRLEDGLVPKEAVIEGASEVFIPVLAATMTTIFAFLPMLLISEEIGKFIRMIPLALVVLLIASLIESFVFLPMHSKDLLHPDTKSLSWEKANTLYVKIITYLVHYKKTTVATFLFFVPLLTFVGFSAIPFQLFPKFDGTQLIISGKLDINNNTKSSLEIAKSIVGELEPYKERFYVKDTYSVAGISVRGSGELDSGENLFTIFLELHEAKEKGFVHNYILPFLAFEFDRSDKLREMKSYEIEEELSSIFAPIKNRYSLEELNIESQKAGIVSRDIDISLVSKDEVKLKDAAATLKKELEKIEGAKDIGIEGLDTIGEIVVEINPYGESLGLSEGMISKTIASLFMSQKSGKSFDSEGIVYIRTKDINKDDPTLLADILIPTPSGKSVRLGDAANIKITENLQKIFKKDGEKRATVFANVNSDINTATNILKTLDPLISELSKEGVSVKIGGEKEKNDKFIKDMIKASLLALGLIFITLLLMFNSFKSTLMILSVIPLSLLGVIIGHAIMGMNLSMPSVIGVLGLAGVVINDGILMLEFIRKAASEQEILDKAKLRLRPIMLTSITTVIGLSTLIFFPSGQAEALQPLAVSLGFGLAWGTVLNLLYLPTLYTLLHKRRYKG